MESGRYKWKIIGVILGSAGVLGSFAAGILLTSLALGFDEKLLALTFIVMSVLNLAANIAWLYGVYKHNTLYIRVPIFWWILPLSLWFILSIIYSLKSVNESLNEVEREYHFDPYFSKLMNIVVYGGMAFGMVFYCVALISYIKLKHTFRTQRVPSGLPISFKRSHAKYIELETL